MNLGLQHIGVIGFSIRVSLFEQIRRWSSESYRECLLVPEIEFPVSLDEDIWPRFEGADKFLGWFGDSWISEENGLSLITNIPLPTVLKAKGIFNDRNVPNLMAVTALLDDIRVMDTEFGDMVDRRVSEASLPVIFNNWPLLGYDVIDRNGTSVLVNCGLGCSWPFDVPIDRKILYEKNLNKFGLFRELSEAMVFIGDLESKINDHPPRYAVAIWATEAPELR